MQHFYFRRRKIEWMSPPRRYFELHWCKLITPSVRIKLFRKNFYWKIFIHRQHTFFSRPCRLISDAKYGIGPAYAKEKKNGKLLGKFSQKIPPVSNRFETRFELFSQLFHGYSNWIKTFGTLKWFTSAIYKNWQMSYVGNKTPIVSLAFDFAPERHQL